MDNLTKKLARSNKRKRALIYVSLLLVSVLVIAILYQYSLDSPFWDNVITDAAWAVFSAVFVLAFVDFVKDEAEEEARKEEVRELVVDAIALNEGLIKRLDNQHVDLLLEQCISHYVDNLSSDNHGANDMAASYVNYIKNHTDVYRSGFEYKVSLGLAENNAVHVVHDVKYKKHFKVASDRAYYLSCFFALQRGGLDVVMSDDSIFFREELLCESLIQNIQSILTNDDTDTAKNEIIDLLDISFKLYGANNLCYEVPNSEVNMSQEGSGLRFTCKIDEPFISRTKNSSGDIFVSYYGHVSCRYLEKKENQFCCMFPNPTMGARFELNFNDNIVKNVETDVNYVTMLSLDDENYKIKRDQNHRQIIFDTKKTIFPRSGFLIQWS